MSYKSTPHVLIVVVKGMSERCACFWLTFFCSFRSFSRQLIEPLWFLLLPLLLSFLLQLYIRHMHITLTARGCGCCCKSNDSKKAWYSFCYFFFLLSVYLYSVFSNTLYPPTPCIGQGDGISLLEYWLCLSFGIEVITVCGVHLEHLSIWNCYNLCAEHPLRGQAVRAVFSSFHHIKTNHVYLFFSAELGITPIRSSTLSSLLFVIVLTGIDKGQVYTKVYTVLLVNISTVYFVSVVMSNFSADNVITHSFLLFTFC